MNTCELCAYSGTPPYKSPCYECFDCDKWEEKEKPMTNADHIRSMSDDELENGIRKIAVGYEPWCDRHCKMDGDANCNECLANWLKAPYKENEE